MDTNDGASDSRDSSDSNLTPSQYSKPAESETQDYVSKPPSPVFANLVLSTEEQEKERARQAAIKLGNLTAAERKRQQRQQRNIRLASSVSKK